jgi:hypothetical protein
MALTLLFFAFVDWWFAAALAVALAISITALVGLGRWPVLAPYWLDLLLYIPVVLKVLVIFEAPVRPSGAHGFFCSR